MSETFYCERSDIEATFGAVNVAKWANLDNTLDTEAIETRITIARRNATAAINDALNGSGYELPLAYDPMPAKIVQIAVAIAGNDLYMGRGIVDTDADGNPIHRLRPLYEEALAMLGTIASGAVELFIEGESRLPGVLPEVVRSRRHHRRVGYPHGRRNCFLGDLPCRQE